MRLVGIVMAYLAITCTSEAADRYIFSQEKQKILFYKLIEESRCLVCQNQSLAESNALFAKELRFKIYQSVTLGKNEEVIKAELTEHYGSFVLFKPPFSPITYFLWVIPFMALSVSAYFFIRCGLRRS
jgi:cytochrome c-type biogenesis protein CcmH